MDYRDYTKSYNWEAQGIKTQEVKLWNSSLSEAKVNAYDTKALLKWIVSVATHTTVWWAAAEAITISWVLATDNAIVSLWNAWTNGVTIASIALTANTLTITFSWDPGNDAIIQYAIIR